MSHREARVHLSQRDHARLRLGLSAASRLYLPPSRPSAYLRQTGRPVGARSLLSFFNYSVLFTGIKISSRAVRQAIGQSHVEFAPRYVRTRKELFLPRVSVLSIHLSTVSYRHASTNFRPSSRVSFFLSFSFLFFSMDLEAQSARE